MFLLLRYRVLKVKQITVLETIVFQKNIIDGQDFADRNTVHHGHHQNNTVAKRDNPMLEPTVERLMQYMVFELADMKVIVE